MGNRSKPKNTKRNQRYREIPRGKCLFTNNVVNIPVAFNYGTWYRVTTKDVPLINGMQICFHRNSDLFPIEIYFATTGSTAQSYPGATFGYRITLTPSNQKQSTEFIPCSNANSLWYQVVDTTTNAVQLDRLSFYGY